MSENLIAYWEAWLNDEIKILWMLMDMLLIIL